MARSRAVEFCSCHHRSYSHILKTGACTECGCEKFKLRVTDPPFGSFFKLVSLVLLAMLLSIALGQLFY